MRSCSARACSRVLAVLVLAVGHAAFAQSPATGQASGTFGIDDRSYKIAHAASFVDAEKRTVLLLTDAPVPDGVLSGKDTISFAQNAGAKPFNGVVFWLDAARTIVRADFYEKSDQTSTSGLFALTFASPVGKTLSGTATATAAARTQKHPLTLNVQFNAAAK